jgi:macrolide transport system ATP-binding/permease protein
VEPIGALAPWSMTGDSTMTSPKAGSIPDASRGAFFATLLQDIRYCLRMLHKSPSFALTTIVTLGLGMGLNTAVFSVVNAIVLRPLPVRDGDRLVVIASERASTRALGGVSFADLQDYRPATADVFEDIAGYSVGFLGLASARSEPQRVLVTWVTGNYFQLLDIRPALGRLIRAEEGVPGRIDPVAVLGYSTWQRRFSGDPSVVGRSVMVNGRACTIVGVADRGFSGTFAFSESELYLPLNWESGDGFDDRQARGLHAIARLRRGVTTDNAQAVMNVVADRLSRQFPGSNANLGARVLPERLARPEESQFRTNTLGAAIILTMVILVMIVAAVNVSNLLLARTASRDRELAIRSALGAGRGRLVRQMVTESLVLAMLGGGSGVLLGAWGARALAAMRLPGDLPVRFDFRLDGRVLAYSLSVAVVTGLLVGLASAVRMSRANPDRILRGSRGGASTQRHGLRGFLVVAQISCCFVLLSGAGAFVRSLAEAERTDLGFNPEGVLNVHMDVGQLGYSEGQGRALFDEIDRRVRSLPGVENASFAFTIPMGYIRVRSAVEAEGQSVDSDNRPIAGRNIVSSPYFHTMGIQIVRGRSFDATDSAQSRPVAVVNQRLADMLWPGQDPIGRRFRSAGSDGHWIEVVGVAKTGKYQSLFEDPQPYLFVPIAQAYTGLRVLQVRGTLPADALAPAVERAIRGLEPNLPLYDVQSMTQALGSGLGFFPVRVGAVAVTAFGVLAFALAIVGLYGVTSCVTSQRTHEIGVRLAIGATHRHIVRLVLEDGSRLVILGVAAGMAMTLAGSRVVGSFLFGVSAYDPFTLLSVVLVLGGVALIACAIPAWRAARVDPTIALRSE